MNRTAPVSFAFLALALSASSGLAQPQEARRTPPPAHNHKEVLCTMIDGNPYSVTIEHGTCDLGEVNNEGGGLDGNAFPSDSPAFNQCLVQEQRRLALCRGMKGNAQTVCVSTTMQNFSLCEQNLPQTSQPF